MKKEVESWLLEILRDRWTDIDFPEYQREPNIWHHSAKKRLLDSVLRGFDIGALYFYRDRDEAVSCIDGRQRIGALMSFFGVNEDDGDNAFPLALTNEIFPEEHPLAAIDGMTWQEIQTFAQSGSENAGVAAEAITRISEYAVTAVLLSDAAHADEFSLQFTRLNLGMTINAGEKLHAMSGDMRDLCFKDEMIRKHPFLDQVRIPIRRFAKEQVAAQILAQVFALEEIGEFQPTRHLDLQSFFKERANMAPADHQLVATVKGTLDVLHGAFGATEKILTNRAIAVSTVVLAWALGFRTAESAPDAAAYAEFVRAFVTRLRWQLPRVAQGLGIAPEYVYLLEFQKHVTQASVERRAVATRHELLRSGYEWWRTEGEIQGDTAFRERTGQDPNESPDI